MAQVLHLIGPVLVGPDDVRPEAWVLPTGGGARGGRVTYAAPGAGHEVTDVAGWVLPGLVDRDAGTLLIRDAGSPSDTRWIDDREDLPRVIRAGRHIARTRRYIR
ncbi:MAG: amidohydrolase family protein, partial [Dermatophilaceae bacterium]